MFGTWYSALSIVFVSLSSVHFVQPVAALPVNVPSPRGRSAYEALMHDIDPFVMPFWVPSGAAKGGVDVGLQKVALNVLEARSPEFGYASTRRRREKNDLNVLQEISLNVLESRSSGSSPCSDLDLDDLQSLPGWPKLAKMANDFWGDGPYEIEINPSGYNDRPATMCVADPVLIKPTAKPNCTHARVDIPRKNGDTSVEVLSGYANVGNWNITHVTSAAHALFFQGTFRTPNMTTPPSGTYMYTQLHSLDVQGEFINAPFNSFSTVATNMTRRTETLTQVQDRTCIATISQQNCVIPSGGRIQLVATGYVWFNFQTKRAPRSNPHGAKHRRFTLKLEDALPNVLDRSAWIDFSGVMNTTLRSDYFDECRWNFQL